MIGPRQQPYFKLHGSMNWQANNGGRLLVMGGNKPTTMQSHQILMWYANKFTEALSRPNARLMVIGYGFGDDHINRLIHQAWEKGGRTLSMFIVHPDGRGFSERSTRRTERVSMFRVHWRRSLGFTTQRDRCGRRSMAAIRVSTISSCNTRREGEVRDDLLDAQACIDWTCDRLPALEECINSWLTLNVVVEVEDAGTESMSLSRCNETNCLDL